MLHKLLKRGKHPKKKEENFKSEFQKKKKEMVGTKARRSEIEMYLADSSTEFGGDDDDENDEFDIPGWCKINSSKYRILSKMAQDILAIPVSTVASESTFSTSGQVLDQYRNRLDPSTIEALIYTQDWLHDPKSSSSEINEFEEPFLGLHTNEGEETTS